MSSQSRQIDCVICPRQNDTKNGEVAESVLNCELISLY